jgi:hypothetical protein
MTQIDEPLDGESKWARDTTAKVRLSTRRGEYTS